MSLTVRLNAFFLAALAVVLAGFSAGVWLLARAGHLPRQAAAQLTSSYRFLRRTEHRLQMVADRQTHRLPERRDAGSAGLGEYPFQLVWWQLGEQHFPKRRLKGRKARADGHREGDDLGHRYSCDVDDVRPIELGER